MERKLEKRLDWAASRDRKADQRFQAAHDLTKDIPLGQPILVGHHSEKRHRRTLERSDQNMRAACENLDMAKHHRGAAAGLERALETSIFSDDVDAVAQLAERIAGLEEQRERIKLINKTARRSGLPGLEILRPALTDKERADIASSLRHEAYHHPKGFRGFPAYVLSNLGGRITKDRERLKTVQAREARQARADAAGGVVIETAGERCQVSFSEYPGRQTVEALKLAGFHWSGGSWFGETSKIPSAVKVLAASLAPVEIEKTCTNCDAAFITTNAKEVWCDQCISIDQMTNPRDEEDGQQA